MERNYIKQNAIIEALEKWDSSDLLCLWNDFALSTDRGNEQIYVMGDIDEVIGNVSCIYEVLRMAQYGKFNIGERYVEIGRGGNLHSFNVLENSYYYDVSLMADYIADGAQYDFIGELDDDILQDKFIYEYLPEELRPYAADVCDEYDLVIADWDTLKMYCEAARERAERKG